MSAEEGTGSFSAFRLLPSAYYSSQILLHVHHRLLDAAFPIIAELRRISAPMRIQNTPARGNQCASAIDEMPPESYPRSRPVRHILAGERSIAGAARRRLCIVCGWVAPTTAPIELNPDRPTSPSARDRRELIGKHLRPGPAVCQLHILQRRRSPDYSCARARTGPCWSPSPCSRTAQSYPIRRTD